MGGATNIKTPLLWALETLNMNCQEGRIPFVVLLTDGAVQDEKEIVTSVRDKAGAVRVLTFGIGQHCNWYFLKMLANQTRGWSSGSLTVDNMTQKMRTMIARASTPVLTDVQLDLSQVSNVEQYPPTIPDLFVGGPLVIAGKFNGTFPSMITLQGTMDGQKTQMQMKTDTSEIVPVAKVFVKQQLDELVARHWLNEDNKVKEEIVNISLNEQLPTPHT